MPIKTLKWIDILFWLLVIAALAMSYEMYTASGPIPAEYRAF